MRNESYYDQILFRALRTEVEDSSHFEVKVFSANTVFTPPLILACCTSLNSTPTSPLYYRSRISILSFLIRNINIHLSVLFCPTYYYSNSLAFVARTRILIPARKFLKFTKERILSKQNLRDAREISFMERTRPLTSYLIWNRTKINATSAS
jgi:hypothetical protein